MHTLKHSTQAPTPEREPILPRNQAPPISLVRTSLSALSTNPTSKQSPTKSSHDNISSPHAKTAPKPINSELERERDSHGRILRRPSQGWYCAVCYTNVTTLGLTVKLSISIKCKLENLSDIWPETKKACT